MSNWTFISTAHSLENVSVTSLTIAFISNDTILYYVQVHLRLTRIQWVILVVSIPNIHVHVSGINDQQVGVTQTVVFCDSARQVTSSKFDLHVTFSSQVMKHWWVSNEHTRSKTNEHQSWLVLYVYVSWPLLPAKFKVLLLLLNNFFTGHCKFIIC